MKTNWKIDNYKIHIEELSEIKYILFSEFENMVKNKDTNVTFTKQAYMPEIIKILRKKLWRGLFIWKNMN